VREPKFVVLMAELRQDPFSGRWVAIAENRAQRPMSSIHGGRRIVTPCPFCAGMRARRRQPCQLHAPGRRLASASWQVRVVPNKYPAVDLQSSVCGDCHELFVTRSAQGAMSHRRESATRGHARRVDGYTAGVDLCRLPGPIGSLAARQTIAYGLIFKNARPRGRFVGAQSQPTPRTPLVPATVAAELASAADFHAATASACSAGCSRRAGCGGTHRC